MKNIKNKKNKNIGILGGTFNPIHYGHLLAAQESLKKFNLNKIIFLPVGNHVYKNNKKLASKEHRYKMLLLATESNNNFYVSDLELQKEEKNYTINTIKEIKKIYKDSKIFFIIGSDLIKELLTWESIEQLFTMCQFIIVLRDYKEKQEALDFIKNVKNKFNYKIYLLKINNFNISSTDIRDKIINKEHIKYFLPENVEDYIYKNNLYKNNSKLKIDINFLDKIVKNNMTKYRYEHSKRVATLSYNLAKLFREDKNKAYFAGMFHDFAKELSKEEKFKLCEKYNIKLDFIEKKEISITHGKIAAEIAKEIFKIEDNNILNAIRYHTTGRKNMTNFEKIIYLADKIEIGRKNNEILDYVRNLVFEKLNLDKAIKEYLKFNMKICSKEEITFHYLSIEALTYLENI